jgi:26S proteasome regulatory subunit N9
LLEYT